MLQNRINFSLELVIMITNAGHRCFSKMTKREKILDFSQAENVELHQLK